MPSRPQRALKERKKKTTYNSIFPSPAYHFVKVKIISKLQVSLTATYNKGFVFWWNFLEVDGFLFFSCLSFKFVCCLKKGTEFVP